MFKGITSESDRGKEKRRGGGRDEERDSHPHSAGPHGLVTNQFK